MKSFKLHSPWEPTGDQPQAINKLVEGLRNGVKYQTLLGVTGSGKTFTMAHVIAHLQRPTLVIAPNKTLAAQLYGEFKSFFPENAVEYFVSYYDYYQPEAYVPQTDTYIAKDASINETIDKMRHSATRALLERRDVIVVSSVSCIYGLGSPAEYREMMLWVKDGEEISRDAIIKKLVQIQYQRNDVDFRRGTFRVRGDVIDIFPAHAEDIAIRIELFGDWIESIREFDALTGKTIRRLSEIAIYPASHYVTRRDRLEQAVKAIAQELEERIEFFRTQNKLVEAQRIEERTRFDMEMLLELGYCSGIENYSRHLSGRKQGEPPPTLLDYFPEDWLLFIDESHITIPQLRGMYRGDRSRKETLVEYGFRLPSALDNRPLSFEEFEERINQVIFVSATPGPYELEKSGQHVVEQLIRPTGLVDPKIEIRPATHQIDDLIGEINKRVKRGQRVLVTTLTKQMAEDLTDYLEDMGIKVRYMHADVETIERIDLIRELRLGSYDVLVGINLLREGLDIPEVSLVAVLDADNEGFLRSERALIQMAGRAARNADGTVILYANNVTRSIAKAVKETERRRAIQLEYNKRYNITPQTVQKNIDDILAAYRVDIQETHKTIGDHDFDLTEVRPIYDAGSDIETFRSNEDIEKRIQMLEKEMKNAAEKLEFEKAALLRDQIKALKELQLMVQ